MKFLKAFAVSLFLLALAIPAQAEVIVNDQEDISFTAYVPCADGGAGEWIEGEGRLHVIVRETVDSAGGVHLGFHNQPQGLKATGQITGDRYNANGVTQGSRNISSGGLPFTDTWINNFRMVGTGRDAVSYHIHQVYQITVNANGEVTALVDQTQITCD